MKDRLDLGPVPAQEQSEQVGRNCDYDRMRLECRTFKEQVERNHPIPDELRGVCGYKVHGNPHEFGTYFEVVAWFDSNSHAAMDWAYTAERRTCEEDFGNVWDEHSRQLLNLPNRESAEVRP